VIELSGMVEWCVWFVFDILKVRIASVQDDMDKRVECSHLILGAL
jgi:hypothetical protein